MPTFHSLCFGSYTWLVFVGRCCRIAVRTLQALVRSSAWCTISTSTRSTRSRRELRLGAIRIQGASSSSSSTINIVDKGPHASPLYTHPPSGAIFVQQQQQQQQQQHQHQHLLQEGLLAGASYPRRPGSAAILQRDVPDGRYSATGPATGHRPMGGRQTIQYR